MCLCSCEDRLNAFSHTWHLYGFSPLWILLCTTRWPDVVNRLLQTEHSNGFFPEWLRLCTANVGRLVKYLPHSVHLYFPVWIFICLYMLLLCKKRFWHWVHETYRFFPVCLFLWATKYVLLLNRLWHTEHKYGLGLLSVGQSVVLASGFRTMPLPAHAQRYIMFDKCE